MELTIKIPAGIVKDCLRVRETSWREPEGAETFETHAPGIGLIEEDVFQFVAHGYSIFDADKSKMKLACKRRDYGD